MKKYQIIYADPPWEVNFQSPLGQGRKYQYSTMKLADIKKLPIRELADTNCGLFLWTTHTYLQEALNLMKIWGFKFHILITWDKGSGLTVCGFHRRTELCLYGYRGNMNLKNHKEGQAISSMFKDMPDLFYEKSTKHSKKPEAFYRLLEYHTPEPRLELFARQKTEGWDVWGNEVESDIDLAEKEKK